MAPRAAHLPPHMAHSASPTGPALVEPTQNHAGRDLRQHRTMSAETRIASLRSRVLRACNWTIGGHVAGQVLRLGTNLVMTRLLVPEMFGIMALANVIMFGLQMFSDLGLRQNIVQSQRGNDPVFLNTAWTVQIVRGALIWLITLGLALGIFSLAQVHWWPTGSVYAEPSLPLVIACLSFNALIDGFESTKMALASRNLNFGRITLIELVCQIAGLAFMLVWAFAERSIWALVFGSIVSSLFKLFLSHTAFPGRNNRLHWDRDAFTEIFSFGKWVFFSSIVSFLAASADRFLMAGLTDPATLGLYAIALLMVGATRDVFVKLIGNVALPALGEVVRERRADLKRVYYQLRAPLDIVTSLATGFLFLAGHLFVRALYDDRYLAAGHMFEILSLSYIELRYALVGQCFLALGKPRLLAQLTLIRLLAVLGLLPLAFSNFGFDGAVWVVTGSLLLPIPYILYLKHIHGLLDPLRELRSFWWLGFGLAAGWLANRAFH